MGISLIVGRTHLVARKSCSSSSTEAPFLTVEKKGSGFRLRWNDWSTFFVPILRGWFHV